jgi:putative endonuclease
MKYFVYALKSLKDAALYIGISSDPTRRLTEHNAGMTRSTKARRPFVLIYSELCCDRMRARAREKFLKSGCGREFLKDFLRP